MLKVLVSCGFCFFRQLDEHRAELENKFTGLRVIFDAAADRYTVKEAIL